MKDDKELTYHYPVYNRLLDDGGRDMFIGDKLKQEHTLHALGLHFNSPSFYPPVGIWLIIDTPEGCKKVKRPDAYVTHNEDMVYLTEEGSEIRGRYPWRYD